LPFKSREKTELSPIFPKYFRDRISKRLSQNPAFQPARNHYVTGDSPVKMEYLDIMPALSEKSSIESRGFMNESARDAD